MRTYHKVASKVAKISTFWIPISKWRKLARQRIHQKIIDTTSQMTIKNSAATNQALLATIKAKRGGAAA